MGRVLHVYRPGDGAAFLGTDSLGSVLGAVVKAGLDLDLGDPPEDGTECRRIGVVALAATPVDDAELYRVKRSDSGVAKPDVNRAPDSESGSWIVQSLIFEAETFTAEQARAWIEEHDGFGDYGAEETSTSHRFRQYDPQHFSEFRVKPLTPGVTAVLGRVKAVAADADIGAEAKVAAEVAAWDRTVRAVNARIRADGIRAVPLPVAKAEPGAPEERYILGLVLEPNDGSDGAPLKPDTQGDVYSLGAIRQTAHGWMERYGQVDLNHSWEPLALGQVRILETYLAPVEFDTGEGDALYHVVKGTWLLALRVIDDAIWEAIKAGQIGAYSVGGLATPEPFTPPAEEEEQKL